MEMTEQLEGAARHIIEDRMRPQIEEARRKMTDLNDRVVSFIKERPGTVLLAAVAVGYIIGRIARR